MNRSRVVKKKVRPEKEDIGYYESHVQGNLEHAKICLAMSKAKLKKAKSARHNWGLGYYDISEALHCIGDCLCNLGSANAWLIEASGKGNNWDW